MNPHKPSESLFSSLYRIGNQSEKWIGVDNPLKHDNDVTMMSYSKHPKSEDCGFPLQGLFFAVRFNANRKRFLMNSHKSYIVEYILLNIYIFMICEVYLEYFSQTVQTKFMCYVSHSAEVQI